jgi:Fic family protein
MTPDDDMLAGRYPHLRFARHWAAERLEYQLGQCDAMVEALSLAPLLPATRAQLHSLSMQRGAQATTAIEGNTLSDEEVERVARGESLPPSKEYEQREVRNILGAFNALLKEIIDDNKTELISPTLLLRFHEMIGRDLGEPFAAIPGRFARSQRVVGPYRAPAPDDVPALVERLCTWIREEFHFPQQRFSEAVIEAVVTHVYIEWIHPFDDGNGRTGRLVEFYILMRAGLPSVASHLLANFYSETRAEYYRQLQRAKQEQSLSDFLVYAVTGLRDGLTRAMHEAQRNAREQMWQVLVYDKFGERVKKRRDVFRRQRDVALALPLDRDIRFVEVKTLTPRLATAYSDATERMILRDLTELERLELIVRGPGLVRANSDLLSSTFARRRKRADPGAGIVRS